MPGKVAQQAAAVAARGKWSTTKSAAGVCYGKESTDLYAVGGPHFKNLLTVGSTTEKEMPVGSMGQ